MSERSSFHPLRRVAGMGKLVWDCIRYPNSHSIIARHVNGKITIKHLPRLPKQTTDPEVWDEPW